MPRHTPGPWAVVDNDGTIYSQARNGQHQICRGAVRGAPVSPPDDERKANAYLKAASPDLLSALKELTEEAFLNMTGGKGHLIDNARRAIFKAETGQ